LVKQKIFTFFQAKKSLVLPRRFSVLLKKNGKTENQAKQSLDCFNRFFVLPNLIVVNIRF